MVGECRRLARGSQDLFAIADEDARLAMDERRNLMLWLWLKTVHRP
jgi:hypothetical protein